MGLWRSLTGPRNSLILLYDHLTEESAKEFEGQITEVSRYYRFVKLSNLIDAARKGDTIGLASVAFRHPRRSAWTRALPFLRAENIPATFFLSGDGVGMNRLPLEEELEWYAKTYPESFSAERMVGLQEEVWENPQGLDAKLLTFRRETGPLPLEKLDPALFFMTWGKLLEIPPELREFGFHLSYNPRHEESLREALKFLSIQTGNPPRVALSARSFPEYEAWGFCGVTGSRIGAVTPGVSLGDLPVWSFPSTIKE